MGYDSTLILAETFGQPDEAGIVPALANVIVEMPRWGWEWSREAHELQSGPQSYSIYLYGEEQTEDAYGMPIRALHPERLLRYFKERDRSGIQVKIAKAMCRHVLKSGWDGTARVLHYGH